MRQPSRWSRPLGVLAALAGPALLTVLLHPLTLSNASDYVFLYVGLVAVLGVTSGLGSALLAAATSFLLVDYYFVPPLRTFTVASETDLVTLVVFVCTAGLVGTLASRRRAAQHRAEALANDLAHANQELTSLNLDHARAAATALRLARSELQVRGLQETDRLRRDLLAGVSHELRTPLASLLTGTTAILAFGDLDPRVRRRLEVLEGEERRLTRLVADLLDVARIEGQTLDLQLRDLDLGEAVEAAAERFRIRNPERTITATGPGETVEVVADWDRLGQILDNLLANADRHAPAGTPIAITVAAGRRGMAVVHVIDQGPGVSPAVREHIFERFVRGPAAGDGPAGIGLGLGLAIVRGLVEAQAGRVWLEDDPGGHFAFTLPLAEVAPPSGQGDGEDVDIDIVQRVNEPAQRP